MNKQELQLLENLKSKTWRLNNLYWIKDKLNRHVKFKLNWGQKILHEELWFLNVILKVRQIGVTTFFCINNLDDTLFAGVDSGIVAHRRDDATKIFDNKVDYAWNHLSPVIKNQFIVDTSSKKELKFVRKSNSRESSIFVGSSLRSNTVQRLHISELSWLDKYYPQRAKEIKSGALNTIIPGQVVSIEGTYKDEGIFSDLCRKAYAKQKAGEKLTNMDYKFFFLAWFLHPEYELDEEIPIPEHDQKYFRKLEGLINKEIKPQKKYWYVKKKEEQRDDMIAEYPSTPEEVLDRPIEGAYYKEQMLEAELDGRITNVPVVKTLPCETWWDIGNDDKMSIIITQQVGKEIHIIDSLNGDAKDVVEYAILLKEKGYLYERHWFPHDSVPKVPGLNKSIKQLAEEAGIRPIIPLEKPFRVIDGIQAGRTIFNHCWFDKDRCSYLILALKHYCKERDEKNDTILPYGTVVKAYKNVPVHNWASHPADAFRYMATRYRWTKGGDFSGYYGHTNNNKKGKLGY